MENQDQGTTEEVENQDAGIEDVNSDSPAFNTALPAGWQSHLEDPVLRDSKYLANFKDITHLAKTVDYQNRQLSKGLVEMPKPTDPEEKWQVFYHEKMGVPKDYTQYENKLNQGLESVTEDVNLEEFQKLSHELNLTQKQHNGILNKFSEALVTGKQQQQAQKDEADLAKLEGFKALWGEDWKSNVRVGHLAGIRMGLTNEEIIAIADTPAGANALFKLARNMGEDTIPADTISNGDLGDIEEQIAKFRDPKHPINKSTTPQAEKDHYIKTRRALLEKRQKRLASAQKR